MNLRKHLVPAVAGLAIAAAGAAAFALPASAAVSVQSQSPSTGVVKIAKAVNLKAKGAAVVVKVTTACISPYSGQLVVTVSEKVGGKVTVGSSTIQVQCDGVLHTYKVSVIPTGRAYKSGTGFAKADLQFCTYYRCHEAIAQKNVTIG